MTLPPVEMAAFELVCPLCRRPTPDVLMCEHVDLERLCVGCCQLVHPGPCPDCLGAGGVALWGTGRSVRCERCSGTGRINEPAVHDDEGEGRR